jgi:hypothetical protein
MRPHEVAGFEPRVDVRIRDRRSRPLPDGPPRARVVLRLDREQVPDRVSRIVEWRSDEPLRLEAPNRDSVGRSAVCR